ncbi:unnamed protein product, partial [Amoebophrya sp. A25]
RALVEPPGNGENSANEYDPSNRSHAENESQTSCAGVFVDLRPYGEVHGTVREHRDIEHSFGSHMEPENDPSSLTSLQGHMDANVSQRKTVFDAAKREDEDRLARLQLLEQALTAAPLQFSARPKASSSDKLDKNAGSLTSVASSSFAGDLEAEELV